MKTVTATINDRKITHEFSEPFELVVGTWYCPVVSLDLFYDHGIVSYGCMAKYEGDGWWTPEHTDHISVEAVQDLMNGFEMYAPADG